MPLFPGEDEGDQVACMVELLGLPPARLVAAGKRTGNFFHMPTVHPKYCAVTILPGGVAKFGPGQSRRGKVRGPPGSRLLRRALNDSPDEQFVEFVARCIEWDPEKRWTPRDAMKHVWLRKKQPDDERALATETAALAASHTHGASATPVKPNATPSASGARHRSSSAKRATPPLESARTDRSRGKDDSTIGAGATSSGNQRNPFLIY